MQLCTGLEAGCETGVRAMARIFEDENTEAMLVDATNALSLFNRQTTLINTHTTCPYIATVTNMYRGDGNLYIQGQGLKSKEGVMQGDPLAMSMYALGILPLIHKLKAKKLVWFADDAAASDSLVNLHAWWSTLLKQGPSFGYPAKTCQNLAYCQGRGSRHNSCPGLPESLYTDNLGSQYLTDHNIQSLVRNYVL